MHRSAINMMVRQIIQPSLKRSFENLMKVRVRFCLLFMLELQSCSHRTSFAFYCTAFLLFFNVNMPLCLHLAFHVQHQIHYLYIIYNFCYCGLFRLFYGLFMVSSAFVGPSQVVCITYLVFIWNTKLCIGSRHNGKSTN